MKLKLKNCVEVSYGEYEKTDLAIRVIMLFDKNDKKQVKYYKKLEKFFGKKLTHVASPEETIG